MKKRTKWIWTVVLALLLVGGGLTAWSVGRAVVWLRDLPNRIVIDIDGDAIAQSLGDAATQSFHAVLTTGDPEKQAKVMQDFSELATIDSTAHEWIQSEFSNDLNGLSSSGNEEVAELATRLLDQLRKPEGETDSSTASDQD